MLKISLFSPAEVCIRSKDIEAVFRREKKIAVDNFIFRLEEKAKTATFKISLKIKITHLKWDCKIKGWFFFYFFLIFKHENT